MHWMSWHKITETKGNGGLGFRDLENFNEALLAKQCWRILLQPNLQMSKVIRARYLRDRNLFESKVKNSDCWVWKSISSARELLAKGIMKRIGDGNAVDYME